MGIIRRLEDAGALDSGDVNAFLLALFGNLLPGLLFLILLL